MDGTAFFRPLVPDDIRQIAVMALSELAARTQPWPPLTSRPRVEFERLSLLLGVEDSSGGRLELRPHAQLIGTHTQPSALYA